MQEFVFPYNIAFFNKKIKNKKNTAFCSCRLQWFSPQAMCADLRRLCALTAMFIRIESNQLRFKKRRFKNGCQFRNSQSTFECCFFLYEFSYFWVLDKAKYFAHDSILQFLHMGLCNFFFPLKFYISGIRY